MIYINEDNDSNDQTMLEELSHYITGASDNTGPFQSFAFQISVVFANKMDEVKSQLTQSIMSNKLVKLGELV
uniref:Uncharacterized protein n=1 Tax=viral metagenome TaxID=1070528 RepID=A0A6M3LMS1_9ZZZZ